MKQRVWIFVAVFLFITNVATLSIFCWHKNYECHNENEENHAGKDTTRNGTADLLAKKLDFTAEQKKSYQGIESDYVMKKELLLKKSRAQKSLFYENLHSENPDKNNLDSLANEIGTSSIAMHKLKADKIFKIRELCTVDQKNKLYPVLSELEPRYDKNKEVNRR